MNPPSAREPSGSIARKHRNTETRAHLNGFRSAVAVVCLFLGLIAENLDVPSAVAADSSEPDPTSFGVPFKRGTTKDSFGRTITYYLSTLTGNGQDAKRPVALLILGSGCQSVFTKRGDMVFSGYQSPLSQEGKGRV